MTEQSRPAHVGSATTGDQPRRQRGLFVAAILLLAAGALYATLAILVRVDQIFFRGNDLPLPAAIAAVPGLDPTIPENSTLSDRINILILGLDQRPHHSIEDDGPPRSDSMYILSIDPATKTGGLLAIPRDLYVEMPNPKGRGEPWTDRINTAFHYGAYYKYPGGGPALARLTVEQTFKLKIDYYMTISWVAFADIIDALDGIEVTVPAPLADVEGFNPRDGNAFTIAIPAGRQRMDSITALAYSRYRGDEEGDLGRIRRQQQVMQAAMEKGLALGWLSKSLQVWNRFRGAVDTDISTVRLPGLVTLAKQIGPDQLRMVSLGGENGDAVREVRTIYGEDVLAPVWEKIVPLVQSLIYDRRLREDGALIRVVNGTATRGQGARVAAYLTRYGVSPSDISGVEGETAERRPDTVIYDYTGKEYTARKLAEWLNLPRSAVQHIAGTVRSPGDPDIVMIVGNDLRLAADPLAAVIAPAPAPVPGIRR